MANPVGASSSVVSTLERLAALKQDGAITETEFTQIKGRLIAGGEGGPNS